MYNHIWLTQANGSARNQEIYEWMTANCSDLFDSITIDDSQSRVRCNIGDSEIFGISTIASPSNRPVIYWKNTAQFGSNGYGYFYGLHRITNGILVDVFETVLPTSAGTSASRKYIPTVAFIKHGNDFYFINITTNTYLECRTDRYILMCESSQTWNYKIDSYLNGNGVKLSRPMPTYYSNVNTNNLILTPMLCTNTPETPTEICYWLKSSPTRDTGLITINGKEYFSNGIFCILNE